MTERDERGVVRKAEDALDRATEPEYERKYASHPGPPVDEADMVAEQQREGAAVWAGPGVPAVTDAQWKGLVASPG